MRQETLLHNDFPKKTSKKYLKLSRKMQQCIQSYYSWPFLTALSAIITFSAFQGNCSIVRAIDLNILVPNMGMIHPTKKYVFPPIDKKISVCFQKHIYVCCKEACLLNYPFKNRHHFSHCRHIPKSSY